MRPSSGSPSPSDTSYSSASHQPTCLAHRRSPDYRSKRRPSPGPGQTGMQTRALPRQKAWCLGSHFPCRLRAAADAGRPLRCDKAVVQKHSRLLEPRSVGQKRALQCARKTDAGQEIASLARRLRDRGLARRRHWSRVRQDSVLRQPPWKPLVGANSLAEVAEELVVPVALACPGPAHQD